MRSRGRTAAMTPILDWALPTALFLLAFFFAPKHGRLAARRRALATREAN